MEELSIDALEQWRVKCLLSGTAWPMMNDKKENRRVASKAFGGHDVSLLLGNDVLASRDWRLTFDEALWSFAPKR